MIAAEAENCMGSGCMGCLNTGSGGVCLWGGGMGGGGGASGIAVQEVQGV